MIHKTNVYDLVERGQAFYKGFKVQFTNEEFKQFKYMDQEGITIHEKNENFIVVSYEAPKSEWEELFK
jgi:hypothetical protein